MIIKFAAFLEREGGYSVVCLTLIVIGVCLVDHSGRSQVAHDLIVFGTGVLARSMGSKKITNEAPADLPPGPDRR